MTTWAARILAAFTRSHLADSMFPRMTSPVARFMIGWRVPRVKILLVNLAKNPNSRADVAATWHSFLVTMSSLLVTIITFGYYIRLLLYVPSPAPERTLSSGRPGCARGCFRRAGRPGPASILYSPVHPPCCFSSIVLRGIICYSSPSGDYKKGRQ